MSSSPEALYHPIPQAPVASNPILLYRNNDSLDLEPEDEETEPPSPNIVADARIQGIYFVLGCAVLLPWNALITATPYFLSRLANTPLQSTFSSYLSITFTIAGFVFLAHATWTSKESSPSRQTIFSLLWLSLLCFLLTLSTLVDMAAGVFFAFVILNGIAQAAAGAYLQNSVIAVASRFGHTTVQATLAGQAAVAVAVSTVQLLSAAASLGSETKTETTSTSRDWEPEERAAFIFFALSTIFLLAAAAAQWWLVTLPQYHIIAGSLEAGRKDVHENGSFGETQTLVSEGRSDPAQGRARILRIAKTNIVYEIAAAYVFAVTLAVFPPITVSVKPTNPNIHPLLFTSVHFLVFGVGDFFSRYLCSFPRLLVWSARKLLALSLARTVFVVLFLMCNINRPSTSPPLINSDFLFMLILFAFGVSNGYVCSMCLMAAPSLEHNPRLKGKQEDIDVAATIAQFCLVGGLAVGSMASFAVRGIVCSCNPFTT
ncbi:hypothetical protein E1B28_004073 [Marasmius oreades]|uniref:Nucleoside transporter-domain-containing protein n=1 Tax=Marasmius oreades TaxID=181124 RepID=A0A9P8ACN2_9AGAR|nr:uncharacterized protein E1B28_004073 [Marasmius oreades]KAG7096658.1 hypothetical protein E1B28_004073 [Marasmius oreades]